MKKCKQCEIDFQPWRSNILFCSETCAKKCRARRHYLKNRTKVLSKNRMRYGESKTTIATKSKEKWATQSAEEKARKIKAMRDYTLKTQFNMTREEYDNQIALQENRCKCCKKLFTEFKKGPAVDHDHKCCSGKKSCGKCFRGLLCGPCNTHLGFIELNPHLILYLEEISCSRKLY